MEKKSKNSLVMTGALLLIFIIYTLCVKFVDVEAIGPEGSSVGFASLNGAIANALTYNSFWYAISKMLGILALAVVFLFGLLGLLQIITRKGILKADKDLYALGIFYILVGIAYVLFEIIVINYRPIIRDEGLEASYPSSHTVLALTVFISAAMQFNNRIKDIKLKKILCVSCIVLAVLIIVSRTLSGVHWFSDILGGCVLSAVLISAYMTLLSMFKNVK